MLFIQLAVVSLVSCIPATANTVAVATAPATSNTVLAFAETKSVGVLAPQEVLANVQSIRKSVMKADKQAIIAIFTTKTESQMHQIVSQYKASYGVDLDDMIKRNTMGDFEYLAVGLTKSAVEFDAAVVHDAIYGFGTDEDALIETLVGRTNAEIEAIKAEYKEKYSKDMVKDVSSDLGGKLRRFFTSVIQGRRDPEGVTQNVDADVQALYADGQKRWFGTESSTFFDILNTRSVAHVRLVLEAYKAAYKNKSLEQVIKWKFGGHMESALLAQIHSIQDRTAFIASEIERSMHGLGTNEKKLMRLVVRYRNTESMDQLKKAFPAMYAKQYKTKEVSLYDRVKGDTSGNLQKGLLAIIGK
jgi:annexin A7/11